MIPGKKGFVAFFFLILQLASKPGASQTFSRFAVGISTEGAGICAAASSRAGLERWSSQQKSGCDGTGLPMAEAIQGPQPPLRAGEPCTREPPALLASF